MTGAGLAILLDPNLAELAERFDHTMGAVALPKDLQQLGKRRTHEGQVATGAHESGPLLTYWARVRYGDAVDFEFDESARALFLTAEGPIAGFEEI